MKRPLRWRRRRLADRARLRGGGRRRRPRRGVGGRTALHRHGATRVRRGRAAAVSRERPASASARRRLPRTRPAARSRSTCSAERATSIPRRRRSPSSRCRAACGSLGALAGRSTTWTLCTTARAATFAARRGAQLLRPHDQTLYSCTGTVLRPARRRSGNGPLRCLSQHDAQEGQVRVAAAHGSTSAAAGARAPLPHDRPRHGADRGTETVDVVARRAQRASARARRLEPDEPPGAADRAGPLPRGRQRSASSRRRRSASRCRRPAARRRRSPPHRPAASRFPAAPRA